MFNSLISNLAAVHVGRIAPHADAGMTAFVKRPVAGPVAVVNLGLAGDEQRDRRFHGGVEKAVYSYPADNYPLWAAELPGLAFHFLPGAMGENLVITGLDETQVCLGDIIRIGTALLQVSEPREPCNTLARVIGTSKIVRLMHRNGRCGWYNRVLEKGHIQAGDKHEIIARPNPDWTIRRISFFATGPPAATAELEALGAAEGISLDWLGRMARLNARA